MGDKLRDEKPLLVMSASAGSGKTHQLVLEYLSILLEEKNSLGKYKSIVAMTFTNKAALEMKTRIINTLDGLANKQFSTKITSMKSDLLAVLPITEDELKYRAKQALHEILHGYEEFHVSTIDKFNLKLIRSFSRDLEIQGDFEVVLNENQILADVVDSMLNRLGLDGYEKLTELVKRYAKHNFEEGQKWNFRDQLIAFAGVLSNEKYHQHVSKLVEMKLDEEAFKNLLEEIKQIERPFLQTAKIVSDSYAQLGIDFNKIPQKSTFHNQILALGNFVNFPSNKSVLFSKKVDEVLKDEIKCNFIPNDLRLDLLKIDEEFQVNVPHFLLLEAYKSNFFNMALLQFIASEMEIIKKEEQIIRISEFNKMISVLVRDEEAPYIYERLGNRLSHFLLDEFQDTSRLQWLNLIPLLHESLSKNKRNLIVGDPKQSIYRFNNGLADQFVSLPAIYNPEENTAIKRQSDYFFSRGKLDTLKNNYRSATQIVSFNNSFFQELITNLSPRSAAFYSSINQVSKSKKEGFVSITSQSKETFEGDLVESIIVIIEKCIADGYDPADICVLSETKRIGNSIANGLTLANYKVVSVDSLLITNDAKVRLCISYLKRREKPSNSTEIKKFAECYFRLKNGSAGSEYLSYFEEITKSNGTIIRIFNEAQFLTDIFGGVSNFFFPYENLYDLIQKFFKIMGWKETEEAYLHHFADVCFAFQSSRHSDLTYFNEYIQENKNKIAIQLPESRDAVQVMTIHKSKGLEFPVVILPQIDFYTKFLTHAKYLIDAGEQMIYKNLAMSSRIDCVRLFSEEEKELILTDKMNLFYVAMTRPENRLYAFNHYSKGNFGELVHEALTSIATEEEINNTPLVIERGNENELKEAASANLDSFYCPAEHTDRLWYPDIVLRAEQDGSFSTDEILYGNSFHLLMAQVNKLEDLDLKLTELIDDGKIDTSFKGRLAKEANGLLENERYASFIDNSHQIKSEESIIVGPNEIKRPDKIIILHDKVIVIDFKTGAKQAKHIDQVITYRGIMEELFKLPIETYLYYSKDQALIVC
jgi:ATP-dependent exoDNAse (exonuclease V) beta subunit